MLDPYLLAKYFFNENSEVLHSAFSLLTYAYKHTPNFEGINKIILPFYKANYNYLKSIRSIEIGMLEAIWLILLGYAGINCKEQKAFMKIITERIY